MPKIIHAGPFMLNPEVLAIILSGVVGYLVLRLLLKTSRSLDHGIIESIEINVLIAITLWKFSLILFDPLSVLTNPLALLYFSGGEHGVWLAAVFMILYFYRSSQKNQVSIWVYAYLLVTGFLAAYVMYNIISLFGVHQTVEIYWAEILIGMLILLVIFRRRHEIGMPNRLNQVVLWFSLSQVGILFLNPLKRNYWRGFSKEQILYIALTILCLGFDTVVMKPKFKNCP